MWDKFSIVAECSGITIRYEHHTNKHKFPNTSILGIHVIMMINLYRINQFVL